MSERDLVFQVARYLQLQYPGVIYRFDLAADLKLTIGQARRHKSIHPMRGYPDLLICVPRRGFHGALLELKKDGVKLYKGKGIEYVTPHIKEQAEVIELLRREGYFADFGLGFEHVKGLVDWYLWPEK